MQESRPFYLEERRYVGQYQWCIATSNPRNLVIARLQCPTTMLALVECKLSSLYLPPDMLYQFQVMTSVFELQYNAGGLHRSKNHRLYAIQS